MRFGSATHHRRSIRLPTFDYRSAGAYFVTICTHERAIVFDDPPIRRAVELSLLSIGRYCRPASVDEFVVMPNHIHAIILISTRDRAGVPAVGAQHTPQPEIIPPTKDGSLERSPADTPCAAPLQPRRIQPASLGAVVRAFKSASTKRINAIRNKPARRSGSETITNTSSTAKTTSTAYADTSATTPRNGRMIQTTPRTSRSCPNTLVLPDRLTPRPTSVYPLR